MQEPGMFSWRSIWVRSSVLSLLGLTLVSMAVGFVWLPSVQADFSAQGLWASICRAAGVPGSWAGPAGAVVAGTPATDVVLTRAMARDGSDTAVGRGATLALNCTMCHGAQGMSTSNAPNLAGQYPEVLMKQLLDYRSGKRSSSVMQAIATPLPDRDITDLAAYYAYLPKARTAPTSYDETLPALVRVGDPMRNIAPCISCHGGIDQKLGAPWLEGLPKDYLVLQLNAFRTGARRNDAQGQMRNMVRAITPAEIDEVAGFYAGKAPPPLLR
jgi:cytochrome c553